MMDIKIIMMSGTGWRPHCDTFVSRWVARTGLRFMDKFENIPRLRLFSKCDRSEIVGKGVNVAL